MSKADRVPAKESQLIMDQMWDPKVRNNPLAFVLFAFPWGQKGTPLANVSGPKAWQREELLRIAERINDNYETLRKGDVPPVYRAAISSGRGIGKSAFVAWLALWQMSCQLGSTTVISANTDAQLTNRTFGEIGKWHTLSINNFWFDRLQKGLVPQAWLFSSMKKDIKVDWQYYYAKGELWNEDDTSAFAGTHNPNGMLLIFDEASGIPKPIWTVSEGFFTDISPYRFWFVFSNPRSNTGPFFECFNEQRDFWFNRTIDSRTVEGLDHNLLNEIIFKNGEDSDEARVEVKGEFPQQGDRQFISRGSIDDATKRMLDQYDDHAALLMGIDPARFGRDSTVIRFRRGRDARSIPPVKIKDADNMKVANICADLIQKFNPDGVFCDLGAGAGVIDRLRQMGFKVYEVDFGRASETPAYADHRTELWGRMREWLVGAMIDDDKDLITDLSGPEYDFMGREDRIKLESKEKMKKRGLKSPDNADALAVTFHAKVARKDITVSRGGRGANRKAKGRDYKILG